MQVTAPLTHFTHGRAPISSDRDALAAGIEIGMQQFYREFFTGPAKQLILQKYESFDGSASERFIKFSKYIGGLIASSD